MSMYEKLEFQLFRNALRRGEKKSIIIMLSFGGLRQRSEINIHPVQPSEAVQQPAGEAFLYIIYVAVCWG